MKKVYQIMLYGYGNPGREDDGLGPALVEKVREWIRTPNMSYVTVDSNYQLNIEDVYAIRDFDMVIFADASVEDIAHFKLTRLQPSEKANYSMHSVSPAYVLHLCRQMYGRSPESFLLHIKGYSFEMREGLSNAASANLDMAFEFVQQLLLEPDRLLDT